MPRIDPLQLLKCLSVLLSPEGGILSRDEVPRLVNLMTKFSKKLVSKCVYVLILKNTETSLVDMFMAEGGWTLIQTWLQDAAPSGNWDLVKEILGLLLITPVDVERLKMNCLPKLIKNLSRREDLGDVAHLSNQIVQNWLIIVKGSAHGQVANPTPVKIQTETKEPEIKPPIVETKKNEELNTDNTTSADSPEQPNEVNDKDDTAENDNSISTNTFYKVSVKDGKQVIKRLSTESNKTSDVSEESNQNEENKDNKGIDKDSKSVEKKKEKSSKSTSSKSKSSSTSRDKDKDKKKSSSSSSSSAKTKSSTSKDKDKDRKDKEKERDRREKERERSKHSSSSKSSSKTGSSSSSKDKKDSKDKKKESNVKDAKEIKDSNESKDPKESKEKQAEKDKDTLEKLKPQTLDKLGRIPKKPSSSTDDKQKENKGENKSAEPEKKKPSFSILNRKATGEERSKTVKVFNSKMRSTGLEEEVKPPPPRSATKKPNPSVQLPTIPPKRPSPPRELSSIMPPEKKLKIDKVDIPERPGAIKLIPPKPKPAVLQESDMFMDALTAAAPKKETKKRKRRLSVTKETPSSPSSSPVRADAQVPASPTPSSPTSALGLKSIAPINFYQDTLSEETDKSGEDTKNDATTEENERVNENSANSPENMDTPASPPAATADPDVALDTQDDDAPVSPKQIRLDGGLKGVLLYSKKKGPKKSIQWKAEESLVEIRYFELDETERVNVTKPFMDMAKMELSSEREALIMSRKLANEDVMEPQIMWRMLYICDQPESLAVPGSKSLEKDIQFAREKSVLPALYFDKRRIPDSPEEPIPENHQMSDPVIIPLEDPESQEIDLRSTPWPEPKGPAPHIEPQPMAPMFQNMPFNPVAFNSMGSMPPAAPFVAAPPRFAGPPGPHGPMPPVPGNFGPPNMMHNNMMGPPMNQPDMMNHPGPINPGMFGPGPEGYIGPANEPNYSMPQFNGPQAPNMNMYSGPNNFSHRGGGRGGGYRRGGNNGGWVQLNGPRSWKRGSGGPRGGRLCKNIQNHGYCRNGDNCPFVH